MNGIKFLTLEKVIHIHQYQINRFGGEPSVRDQGMLESALAQPLAMFGGSYLHSYPFEMASAYLFHIVKNHPFIDGNKRTGAVAALVFLRINGIGVVIPEGMLADVTLKVAESILGKSELAGFFERYVV